MPLDPEPESDARKSGTLKSSLAGLFVGVVLYFALRAVADPDVALFGLFPAAFGVASLISYFLESRRKAVNGADSK